MRFCVGSHRDGLVPVHPVNPDALDKTGAYGLTLADRDAVALPPQRRPDPAHAPGRMFGHHGRYHDQQRAHQRPTWGLHGPGGLGRCLFAGRLVRPPRDPEGLSEQDHRSGPPRSQAVHRRDFPGNGGGRASSALAQVFLHHLAGERVLEQVVLELRLQIQLHIQLLAALTGAGSERLGDSRHGLVAPSLDGSVFTSFRRASWSTVAFPPRSSRTGARRSSSGRRPGRPRTMSSSPACWSLRCCPPIPRRHLLQGDCGSPECPLRQLVHSTDGLIGH